MGDRAIPLAQRCFQTAAYAGATTAGSPCARGWPPLAQPANSIAAIAASTAPSIRMLFFLALIFLPLVCRIGTALYNRGIRMLTATWGDSEQLLFVDERLFERWLWASKGAVEHLLRMVGGARW
ncbi:hypothetical protein AWC22_25845 [Mycobacterium riyadhense]|uniref:Uncharacterized protein n=1 Tax=Mycobacterium riyadhense TaxID=486698 RepID=A0A1X2BZV2_9MYCO|nr:hypothetical protein AWC22_25845 [Mycobacterium riyadhense]VTO97905.1 hypothetical protein BIN_B_02290 [Mycobacterium riyadhense]